ncbi:hypothetical protein TSUD_308740 [Trifolium subterraneum]|nr:hypothetical protein TSUD_308740 [Trifolium subterraneum]
MFGKSVNGLIGFMNNMHHGSNIGGTTAGCNRNKDWCSRSRGITTGCNNRSFEVFQQIVIAAVEAQTVGHKILNASKSYDNSQVFNVVPTCNTRKYRATLSHSTKMKNQHINQQSN